VTIGTNIALRDGSTLVDRVSVGEGSLVGHLTMLAPGVQMGANSQVDVGCGLGLGVRVGENSLIHGWSGLYHFAQVGQDVRIESGSYVGLKARVGNGLIIPPGALVPPRVSLKTPSDVEGVLSTSNSDVVRLLEKGPGLAGLDAVPESRSAALAT
jgi:UDP-3-O-[3-hydroxymyristoyl] glucosamine N-acyltransferase